MDVAPAPALSLWFYLALLGAVGAGRLREMTISRRHRRTLAARGAKPVAERGFALMVALHAGVLAGAAAEAWLLRRPFVPVVALPMLTFFALGHALRLWVIRTMAEHWNVRVMDSVSLGVVSGGPFRFVRHPNYVAVFVELAALPLVHGAWITALVCTLLHVLVLGRRIAVEDAVLLADPGYRALMGGKPRFLPVRVLR